MVIPLDHFFCLVDAYARATGLAEATISTRVFNDGQRIEMLRAGRDVGVRKLVRAVEWLSAHWPPEAEWPSDVPRPVVTAVDARAG